MANESFDFGSDFENYYEKFHAFIGMVFAFICKEIDGINKKFVTYDELKSHFKIAKEKTKVNNAVIFLAKEGLVIRDKIKGSKREGAHIKIYLSEKGKSLRDYFLEKYINHGN